MEVLGTSSTSRNATCTIDSPTGSKRQRDECHIRGVVRDHGEFDQLGASSTIIGQLLHGVCHQTI
eukprot:3018003-Amphidinium_carterae.2